MGMSRKHKDAFKLAHPTCIFCGGANPMTTIEHCPPRAMFQNREWPEGFEFPACGSCNHGSADDDLIISLLARLDPFSGSGGDDGRLPLLASSIRQQHPGLISRMYPTPGEARKLNRSLGLLVAKGKTQQESGVAKVLPEMHRAVEVFAAKLAKAIFYKETNTIFPVTGDLLMKWSANSELVTQGSYTLLNTLADLPGHSPNLKRGKNVLNKQFSYALSISEGNELFAIRAVFGRGFALVVFGNTQPGGLENHYKTVEEITGSRTSFTVIHPRPARL